MRIWRGVESLQKSEDWVETRGIPLARVVSGEGRNPQGGQREEISMNCPSSSGRL